jgi:phosphatidylglycerol---prolipoprotein diacylglyceryl transferase
MHPEFIRLGPLDIHTYGVLVAIGFMVGLWVAMRRAPSEGIRPEQVTDLGVWLIISGMLGGKLFHVIFFWNDFIAAWHAEGLRSLREGFVFYGGFIVASLTAVAYARLKRLPLAKLADVFAPAIALGHAFGRLGCFFNGCCYGKACAFPWAVKFPQPHLMAGIPVHPTELYEALGLLAIFSGLTAFYRRKRFDGQVWWLYVLSYGALRFLVEFFRGDYEMYYGGVFTLGHVIAGLMMVVALTALACSRRVGTSRSRNP